MRTVGVLGGMGPEATLLLMSRVMALTSASDDSDHVPMLIDNNTQVPSRIKALIDRSAANPVPSRIKAIIEKTGEDPGPVLIAMARRLVQAGVEALAMPCNTAHHYAPLLKESISVPFLDMVELTADRIQRLRSSADPAAVFRVGMLASPAVRITGVFDPAFSARGLKPVYPPDQDGMLTCIRMIKAGGENSAAIELLQNAAIELIAMGVDALLVACSELSIIKNSLLQKTLVIDTIDVLAEAVISFSRDGLDPRM